MEDQITFDEEVLRHLEDQIRCDEEVLRHLEDQITFDEEVLRHLEDQIRCFLLRRCRCRRAQAAPSPRVAAACLGENGPTLRMLTQSDVI